MPLSDWPLTSSFQSSTPAWELTLEQFRSAMDGSNITAPESVGYWGSVNIATLEANAGISLDLILTGMRAARNSTQPDNMRSMKTLGGPPFRFIQFNVPAFETATGITAVTLRNAINAAV